MRKFILLLTGICLFQSFAIAETNNVKTGIYNMESINSDNSKVSNTTVSLTLYKGMAFVLKNKVSAPDGKEYPVSGNLAKMFFSLLKLPSPETMKEMAKNNPAPIIEFVAPGINGGFDIRYYLSNGMEIPLCGHGTLVAAKVLYEKFRKNEIKFFPNPDLESPFTCKINNDLIKIENFKTTMPKKVEIGVPPFTYDIFSKMCSALSLTEYEVAEVYLKVDTNEYILILNEAEKLDEILVDYSQLKKVLHELDNSISVFVTVKSDFKGYDYKVRVFLENEEDFACGSAQKALIPLWHKKLFPNKDNIIFNVIFPGEYKTKSQLGSVMNITFFKNERRIDIQGEAKIISNSYFTL